MRVIGYARVSTAEQTNSGAGLGAQRNAISAACDNREWTLVDIVTDGGLSGGTPWAARPGLAAAVSAVEGGDADGIVVAKLDRLTRSLHDFASLMERSRRKHWSIVALDLGVDTSTPAGEAMASVMATFAQLERRLIGQRTREALAEKRAQGVVLGRPRVTPPDVRERIRVCRDRGMSYRAIADGLNADGVPTAHDGDRWWPASVRRLCA